MRPVPRGGPRRRRRRADASGLLAAELNSKWKEKTEMPLLEVKNLHARVAAPGGREILKGVDLIINEGEVHAIMGKNGSGKSTLCQVLAGREAYEVTEGTVRWEGKDLLEMLAEEWAQEGVFLVFQYLVEIPGVSTNYFLRAAVN